MNIAHSCGFCHKTFKYQFAREFHLDLVHDLQVCTCNVCNNVEQTQQKRIEYSYFELLDHICNFHESNPYTLIDYLNLY